MSCWHPCSACLTTTTLVGPFTIASACRLWTLGGRNPLACEMDEKQARDERSVLDPSLAVAVTQCVWHHTRPGIPVPTVTKSKNENKQSRITQQITSCFPAIQPLSSTPACLFQMQLQVLRRSSGQNRIASRVVLQVRHRARHLSC